MAAHADVGPTGGGARRRRSRSRGRIDGQRARILASARVVLSARGYARTSFLELAEAAGTSPAGLHHHFPGGRAELVVAVAEDQLEEMVGEVRRAARVPHPPSVRLERLLRAMFDYLVANPGAYRLLFGDAVLAADPRIAPLAAAARVELTAEVAGLLAGSAPAPEVVAASAGVVGFAMANIGLCLAGGLQIDHACRLTCEFCTSQLPPQRAPHGG